MPPISAKGLGPGGLDPTHNYLQVAPFPHELLGRTFCMHMGAWMYHRALWVPSLLPSPGQATVSWHLFQTQAPLCSEVHVGCTQLSVWRMQSDQDDQLSIDGPPSLAPALFLSWMCGMPIFLSSLAHFTDLSISDS